MQKLLTTILGICLIQMVFAQTTIVNYTASTDDFVNPERGFYRYSETKASSYSLLNSATIAAYRNQHTPPTASYQIYSSLVFRYFILDDFVSSNISNTFLTNMQADFDAARVAGVKLIPRFAYTIDVDNSCGNWICPPYGDASKTWVLTHLGQLQSVLQANEDVIAVVQMGFIGTWGENYYTDFFGDASMSPFKLTNANWQDRIDVLDSMLNVVPSNRMVQARYPQKKQRTIYGITAPTNSAAITSGQAHTGSDIARIGFHNDCLLASADDFGTFFDYGNDVSSAVSDTTNLKPYFDADADFVAVGGETCFEYNPYNDCAATDPDAYADTELKRFNYSYLNSQYNNDVNNDWVGICMDDILKELGYRFELQSGTYSNEAQPDQVISINISLINVGFAAPYNPRGLELILRNTSTSTVWYAQLTDDPRFWLADGSTHTINHTLCIPSSMPTGTYEVLLNLPDPQASIYSRTEYAIRLANKLPSTADVWESATGYNDLGHTIIINNTASNSACAGEITFTTTSSFLPVELSEFRANPFETSIKLNWTTAQEYENQGFNLQRSEDAIHFENIAWVTGQGTTSVPTSYEFDDFDIEKGRLYYYRLEQIDWDGTKQYSHLVSGFIENKTGGLPQDLSQFINIFPNPAKDYLLIRKTKNLQGDNTFEVYDFLGRKVDAKTLDKEETYYSIDHLKRGIYFFEFRLGTSKFIKKVIVQ